MSEENKEAAEATKNTKFKSRKFLVWIVASIFEAAAFALSFITKNDAIVQAFTGWWGGISLAYIGGNVAQKITKPTITE